MSRLKLKLDGIIFGDLKVIKFSHTYNNKSYWKTICMPCGKEHIACGTDMKQGKVLNCGCTKNKGKRNGHWKGYQGISGRILGHYKYFAKKRRISFKINIKHMWEQYLKQNKKCPYTKIDLILESKDSKSRLPSNASLDRIDSTKGYEPGNIQWVFKKINILKNDLSQKEFLELCNLVAKNCPI